MVLCRLALGDVGHDVDQAQGFAIRAAGNNPAAARQPEDLAPRLHDAILGRKRVLLVRQLVEMLHQVTVVGVERRPELIGLTADVSAAIGEREAEQGHAFVGPGPCAGHEIGFPRTHAAGFQCQAIAGFALAQALQQTGTVERGSELIGQRFQQLEVGLRKTSMPGRAEGDGPEQTIVREQRQAGISLDAHRPHPCGRLIATQMDILDGQWASRLGDLTAQVLAEPDPAKSTLLSLIETARSCQG